jgi:hypothetical protein
VNEEVGRLVDGVVGASNGDGGDSKTTLVRAAGLLLRVISTSLMELGQASGSVAPAPRGSAQPFSICTVGPNTCGRRE